MFLTCLSKPNTIFYRKVKYLAIYLVFEVCCILFSNENIGIILDLYACLIFLGYSILLCYLSTRVKPRLTHA